MLTARLGLHWSLLRLLASGGGLSSLRHLLSGGGFSTWTSSGDGDTPLASADPGAPVPSGAFFGRVRTLGEGTVPAAALGDGGRYVVLARHVPTDAVLASMAETFGEGAAEVLSAWRAGWDKAARGDVARLARKVGYVGFVSRAEPPMPTRVAARLASGKAGAVDAEYLVRPRGDSPHAEWARPEAFHALEDAFAAVALRAAGVRVSYLMVTRGFRGRTRMESVGLDRAGTRPLFPRGTARAVGMLSATPQYWNAPSFHRACRRAMAQADGMPHAAMVLLDMARQGHARAFAKHCSTKGGTWVVSLAGVTDARTALGALVSALGVDAFELRERGAEGRLLLQAFEPFAYEHRFFVVSGRVVASTASDRGLSMLDVARGPGRLDPRVAVVARPARDPGPYDRGETSSGANRPLVAAMAKVARRLARETARDDVSSAILGEAYVVDVGSDGPDPRTARVDLIEVNDFRRAGLYAVDYGKVARALAKARMTGQDSRAFAEAVGWRRAVDGMGLPAMMALAEAVRP